MASFDLQSRIAKGKRSMFFETVTITPEIAHELIALNTHNRAVSRSTIQRYRLDMANENWPLTAEAIVVDRNGVLQNGQHRLLALIAANVTVTFTVCWGALPEAFSVIDQGYKRNLANVAGLIGIANGAAVASATRLIFRYDVSPGLIWTGSNAETGHANLVEFLEANRDDLSTAVNTSTNLRHAMPQYNQSIVTAVSFLINRDSSMREDADPFWEALKTGANLEPGDACLTLRNRELSGYPLHRSNSWRVQLRFAIWIKGWNAYVEGRKVSRLVFSRNELPMPKIL